LSARAHRRAALARQHPAFETPPRLRATIAILGINPYVLVPPAQLEALFSAAGRHRGPIPITVELGQASFRQNLVRYRGAWRLYLNTPMRRAAGKEVGDQITLGVRYDPAPRVERVAPAFKRALAAQAPARAAFAALPPSRKKEILRYLNGLKTRASLERNVDVVIRHLRGERPATLRPLFPRKAAAGRAAGAPRAAAATRSEPPPDRARLRPAAPADRPWSTPRPPRRRRARRP
jgi:hypothetical protein